MNVTVGRRTLIAIRVEPVDPEWPDGMPVMGLKVGGHLAVTPETDSRYGLSGQWSVTHLASGYRLTNAGGCIACAERAALLATEADVDWSRPRSEIQADEAARTAAKKAKGILFDCESDSDCPREQPDRFDIEPIEPIFEED